MESVVKTDSNDIYDNAERVRRFEASEDATYSGRKLSERDRDYYDNIQYTDDELEEFKKRGQPPVVDNRIKTKIDYLIGLEKQQRIDPRCLPRTPMHEEDANAASQALNYVADSEDYDEKRSGVWRNLLIEGDGGISVAVEYGYDNEPQIVIRRWPWDRMYADPHSSEPDYSDAGYLGGVIWMDHAEAEKLYSGKADILSATLAGGKQSETYDDKPKYRLWADTKRKRIRICVEWFKVGNEWHFCEFTKGGNLKWGKSPYVTDKGESDCEMVFQSAYVNRDNERYGLVREMISLQDAVNKRGSKLLHLINTRQVWYEDGSVDDVNTFHKQVNRPDGKVKFNPGALRDGQVQVHTNLELATAHFQLLQDSKNSIDLKGPNATMMGDKAQGSSAASGRAILASQQGGMIQLGDLMDHLRHMDKQVFRKIWYRIRQFWTAEKWVRITDDERNVKWVAMNVDPQQIQLATQQNPEIGQRIAGVIGNVAELDCDIIIDEVADGVVPAVEQFQALIELKQFDAGNEIPFRALVSAAPNLKDKQKFLEAIDQRAKEQQQDPMAQAAKHLQLRGAQAQVDETEQSAFLKNSQAQKALADASMAPMGAMGQPQQIEYEVPPDLQNEQAFADIENTRADTVKKLSDAHKVRREAELAPHIAAQEAQDRAEDRRMRLQQSQRAAAD